MQEKALAHGFPYFHSTGGLRGIQNSAKGWEVFWETFFRGEKG